MSRRKPSRQPGSPPVLPPDRAVDVLRRHLERGQELLSKQPFPETEYDAWANNTREYLLQAFGSDSGNVAHVMAPAWNRLEHQNEDWATASHRALMKQLGLLKGCIEQLEETQAVSGSVSHPTVAGKDVFVVHGHDQGAKATVARFITQLDLNPIVLHEQPDEGRTIIEKFEAYSRVAFAVVLLTPDDRGGPHDGLFDSQRGRARQNVILELGYFLGKLGRRHVRCLYWEGVEIPSDYGAVLFIPFDQPGAWRFRLASEIKAAGIDIDLNLVM